jgi:hypothetical protein
LDGAVEVARVNARAPELLPQLFSVAQPLAHLGAELAGSTDRRAAARGEVRRLLTG